MIMQYKPKYKECIVISSLANVKNVFSIVLTLSNLLEVYRFLSSQTTYFIHTVVLLVASAATDTQYMIHKVCCRNIECAL